MFGNLSLVFKEHTEGHGMSDGPPEVPSSVSNAQVLIPFVFLPCIYILIYLSLYVSFQLYIRITEVKLLNELTIDSEVDPSGCKGRGVDLPVLRLLVADTVFAETPVLWQNRSAISRLTGNAEWMDLTWAPARLDLEEGDDELTFQVLNRKALLCEGRVGFDVWESQLMTIGEGEESGSRENEIKVTVHMKPPSSMSLNTVEVLASVTAMISRNPVQWEWKKIPPIVEAEEVPLASP